MYSLLVSRARAQVLLELATTSRRWHAYRRCGARRCAGGVRHLVVAVLVIIDRLLL